MSKIKSLKNYYIISKQDILLMHGCIVALYMKKYIYKCKYIYIGLYYFFFFFDSFK